MLVLVCEFVSLWVFNSRVKFVIIVGENRVRRKLRCLFCVGELVVASRVDFVALVRKSVADKKHSNIRI